MQSISNTGRQDRMSLPQRVAEPLVTACMTAAILAFFLYHQRVGTGFFTARFGPLEMLCLYGSIILSLAAPITRGLTGDRNAGRPLEALAGVAAGAAALWLLRGFPFDFAHLADALPGAYSILLAWGTNDIGRIVLIAQAILAPFAALVTLIAFVAIWVSRHSAPVR